MWIVWAFVLFIFLFALVGMLQLWCEFDRMRQRLDEQEKAVTRLTNRFRALDNHILARGA